MSHVNEIWMGDITQMGMSHVTRWNESCHTLEWVMSHVGMSHVSRRRWVFQWIAYHWPLHTPQTSRWACCSVLQCVAVCCSVLQCDAVCCSVLQRVAACCSVLQRVAACCSTAVRCRVLQCAAVWYFIEGTQHADKLHIVVQCCSVLQCGCCSAH